MPHRVYRIVRCTVSALCSYHARMRVFPSVYGGSLAVRQMILGSVLGDDV